MILARPSAPGTAPTRPPTLAATAGSLSLLHRPQSLPRLVAATPLVKAQAVCAPALTRRWRSFTENSGMLLEAGRARTSRLRRTLDLRRYAQALNDVLYALVPLGTPRAASVAFNAALLGVLASFLATLLGTPADRAAQGSGLLLFALVALIAWCAGAFADDLRRLLKLILRWPPALPQHCRLTVRPWAATLRLRPPHDASRHVACALVCNARPTPRVSARPPAQLFKRGA